MAQVDNAFNLAYQVCRSAELELAHWAQQPEAHRRNMWRAMVTQPTSTLEYWFGGANERNFNERFDTVVSTVAWWSYRFRHGFYTIPLPVYLHCKPNYNFSDWICRHSAVNTITLYRNWFNYNGMPFGANSQAGDLLHEMGHLSQLNKGWLASEAFPVGGLLGIGLAVALAGIVGPTDRRNSVCPGKCYSETPMTGPLYVGTRPRALVTAFEGGSDSAYRDMIHNIDNYVCYMWNRYQDRGRCFIRVGRN
jgi:hypothetical protein